MAPPYRFPDNGSFIALLVLKAISRAVYTAEIELAGPATNGSAKIFVSVVSASVTSELVASNDGKQSDSKLQPSKIVFSTV